MAISADWRWPIRLVAVATLLAASGLTVSVADEGGIELPPAVQETATLDHHYYPRSAYVWPFSNGPHYGKVRTTSAREPGVLFTRVGTFRLNAGRLPFPEELLAENRLGREARQYFIVQLHPESLTAESLSAVESAIRAGGGEVMRHLPVSAMIARLTPQAHRALQGTVGLISLEPYHPAFKIDPTVGRQPLLDSAAALSEVWNLDIQLFRGEDAAAVAAMIERIGGAVTKVWPHRIQAGLHYSRLAELARLEPVYAIHERQGVVRMAQETTNTMQTGAINFDANPYHDAGVRGAGQVLYVLDDGISLDAADLAHSTTSPGTPGPGHRKVLHYVTTADFGGGGDLLACDAPAQGGFTHGHLVAATALGNAAHTDTTFRAVDQNGLEWNLFGVAPAGLVAFYDALVTPAVGGCDDPLLGLLDTGTLWDGLGGGSMEDAYTIHGARAFVLPFGETGNTYDPFAEEIDGFLDARRDAFLVVPMGNEGGDAPPGDGFSDPNRLNKLATAKNAITVGASRAPDDFAYTTGVLERAGFSAVGPAGATNRIAPILMAPGSDYPLDIATGLPSEYACSSADNDNDGAVVCDQVTYKEGTSFAAAAVAGAGMLVRDWFAQGFYPDGTSQNASNDADRVGDVSGALVTAVLVNSAEFLGVFYEGMGTLENLNFRYRFNNEQGYGRVRLDYVLPLAGWGRAPSGMVLVDGGIDGPGGANVNDIGGTLTGSIDAISGGNQQATFRVCDDSQELRAALAWVEPPGDALINELDLELQSPSGRLYYGNYYTDDDNRDGIFDAINEDCPTRFDDGTSSDNGLDRSRFSLETCIRLNDTLSPHDSGNNTESIVLSPNPARRVDHATGAPVLTTGICSVSGEPCGYDAQCGGNETCDGGTSQVETGLWTVRVLARGGGAEAAQRYALVVSGGVCSGSSVRLDAMSYSCNTEAALTIYEYAESGDPASNLSAVEVASRTVVEVVDAEGTVVDEESGTALGFTQPYAERLQFTAAAVTITDSTAYSPGNGVLDVRHGDVIRVRYHDQTDGAAAADKLRVATADARCKTLLLGGILFSQFGQDQDYAIVGGCERNARGLFEFGFPDKYMDADERLKYRFAFANVEVAALRKATVSLTCKLADADSPAGCKYEEAASPDCPDPQRANNPGCGGLMTIADPVRTIGLIPGAGPTEQLYDLVYWGTALSVDWDIEMGPDTVFAAYGGTPEVDLVLEVVGSSGKTTSSGLVRRHELNVDELSQYYSTDFPHGGVEFFDRNNDGLLENPRTTGPAGAPWNTNTDYYFETRTWSDLTACTDAGGNPVTCNEGLQSPWNFDTSDGGFRSGLASATTEGAIAETIAQWGEDKNFNNQLDGRCESEPSQACDRFPQDPINCGTVDLNFDCINLENRDPVNFPLPLLDQNWSTRGGCGWQTRAPRTCSEDPSIGCYDDADCSEAGVCGGPAPATGGVWHTGVIGGTTATDCVVAGSAPGQCQIFETIGGTSGQLVWWELLTTPIVEKVNKALLPDGRRVARIEIEGFRWNAAIDLPDNNVYLTRDLDTDIDRLEPNDLKSDTLAWYRNGPFGPVTTGGGPIFAPLDPATGQSFNGTVGGNRAAKNSCFFEGGAVSRDRLKHVGLPGPPDDDAPEGYCPFGGGLRGREVDNTSPDLHLNYCTLVCSEAQTTPCAADGDCQGVCLPGLDDFCSNAPTRSCVQAADCNLGACVDVLCNGSCDDGTCSTSGDPCDGDADCEHACVLAEGSIDQFVSPSGPVRQNGLGGPDMRFQTLEDVFRDTGGWFERSKRMKARR